MVKIPETSPQYHHYFIHDFFFPIINSYRGIDVAFVWTKQNKILSRVTQILEHFPIRKNDSIMEFNRNYYKTPSSKEELKTALG